MTRKAPSPYVVLEELGARTRYTLPRPFVRPALRNVIRGMTLRIIKEEVEKALHAPQSR